MPEKGAYTRPALDKDKIFDELNTSKWLNLIFHVMRLIVALVCFGICSWVRFDLDFRVWVPIIDWYSYWYCMYVIWVACSFEILVSILGVLGVLQVSQFVRKFLEACF